jgi:hypothetical protein
MSWLRDWRTMFLLYLAVGFAFVPAGLLYALAGLAGWDNWPVAAGCLGFGFLTAYPVWTNLERRLTAGARRTAMGEGLDDLREKPRVVVNESHWVVHTTSKGLVAQPGTSIRYTGEIPVQQRLRTGTTRAPVTGQS